MKYNKVTKTKELEFDWANELKMLEQSNEFIKEDGVYKYQNWWEIEHSFYGHWNVTSPTAYFWTETLREAKHILKNNLINSLPEVQRKPLYD